MPLRVWVECATVGSRGLGLNRACLTIIFHKSSRTETVGSGWPATTAFSKCDRRNSTKLPRVSPANCSYDRTGRMKDCPTSRQATGMRPALRSRDGNIWIPMLTGLAIVHPYPVNSAEFLLLSLLTGLR